MIGQEFCNDYFMKPTFIDGVGNVYPIKVKEYEEFKLLANRYLVNDLKNIYNLQRINFDLKKKERKIPRNEKLKLQEYDSLFDYIVTVAKELNEMIGIIKNRLDLYESFSDEEIEYCIELKPELKEEIESYKNGNIILPKNEVYTLLEMVLHEEVFLIDGVFKIGLDGDYELNKDNFELFREQVMKSNLLYKPLIGHNLISNQVIEKALLSRSKKQKESALESIFATVSIKRNLTDEQILDYTWYRLMYDYSIISREHFNQLLFMGKCLGANVDIPELSEKVDLYNNPYDGLLQKHEVNNSFDRALK